MPVTPAIDDTINTLARSLASSSVRAARII